MPFTMSDMPFGDNTPQEEIERRRADRMARKKAQDEAKTSTRSRRRTSQKAVHHEKKMLPNLTGRVRRVLSIREALPASA